MIEYAERVPRFDGIGRRAEQALGIIPASLLQQLGGILIRFA